MRTALVLISVTIAALASGAGVKRIGYAAAPEAAVSGNRVTLTFTAALPPRMSGHESVRLIPCYVSGTDTVWYPEMGIYTRSGARYHRRRVTVGRERRESVEAVCGGGVTEVAYSASRYVPGTAGGILLIRQELHDCCRSSVLAVDTVCRWPEASAAVSLPSPVGDTAVADTAVAAIIDTAAAVIDTVAAVIDTVAAVRLRDSVTLRLDYPSGGSEVMPQFGDNRADLALLDTLMRRVRSGSDNRITGITIDGYASPEDTYEHNKALSRRRVEGMRRYISEHYSLSPGLMKARAHGEDWEGLCAALRSGRIAHADEALGIISRYGVTEGREKRLMDLRGGDTYREMLAEIFPELRRITVTVEYVVAVPEGERREKGNEGNGRKGESGINDRKEVWP